MIFNDNNAIRTRRAATAVLVSTMWVAGALSASGQSAEPLKTVIPVHIDASSGNITVGPKTYTGQNPGMHLLALKRKPDRTSLNSPDLVQDGTFNDAASANAFLTNVLSSTPDAFLFVNAVGAYGLAGASVASNLEKFGATGDVAFSGPVPLVVIGNGGRKIGQALQRGNSTQNIDGYLAQDTNGNYAFIQTDYVRYDITTDGTINIGTTPYDVASSFKPGCSGAASNSFHLVVVNRETLSKKTSNTYCTAESDSEINRLTTDLEIVTTNLSNEDLLVFLASNGHPIPANWAFGTDGDARIVPLAREIAQLGGYWETMVYLTPIDTYSLVGAPPPPAGTPGAGNRARESSSVYPDNPTGELHGVLAREKRGIRYSPLNADPTGIANLDLYKILAQTPIAFPHPTASPDEQTAFQYINQKLCRSATCNVRNQYPDTNISVDDYFSQLENMRTPDDKDCDDDSNANLPFCLVRGQLLDEFEYVSDIRGFRTNLQSLWLASGTTSIFSMLSAYNDIQAALQAPTAAPAPNIVNPIVGFVLGLASFIPEVGPLFGLADTAFNFATGLTTDTSGNTTASLTSTVGQLQQQAIDQFGAQETTTAIQFDLIYQDWGKIQTLGDDLAGGQPGDDWYWDDTSTGQILEAMAPAVSASYYRSLMPAVYAIGSYMPTCHDATFCDNYSWGKTPVFEQPQTYVVGTNLNTHCCQPFNLDPTGLSRNWYMPFTYPADYDGNRYVNISGGNPYELDTDPRYTQGHNTILADNAWLGISLQSTSQWADANGLYQPPQEAIMTNLFTPRSQGGLGIYRPEFFEGWPFPKVQCYTSDVTGADQGCPWSSGSPSPEALPDPVTSVAIHVGQATRTGSTITVPLIISNNGTLATKAAEISAVSLRTLVGSGDAMVVDPLVPIKVGALAPGSSSTIELQLLVPEGITKLRITEEGSLDSGQPAPTQFSQGQVVFPEAIK